LTNDLLGAIVVLVGNKPYRTGERMTRKDYKLIASVIKKHRDASAMAKAEFAEMIYSFSECLAYENMAFNSEKFEEACGLNSH
jgi:hypothetical protein